MDREHLKELIRQELSTIIREDETFRQFVLQTAQQNFADKQQTESRFDRILNELQRDREEQARKWEAWKKEDKERWETWKKEDQERWQRQDEKDRRQWEAWRKEYQQDRQETTRRFQRVETHLTAIGARWGMRSEKSFRSGLRGILVESFGVQVQNVIEFDADGDVFGRPHQIELDIIIKNGLLIICELKSSMSYSDMNSFDRKIRFYEKRHHRQADRRIVISPMISPGATRLAQELGIETYSYVDDVEDL